MKNRVKVNGLTFVPYITSERIAEQVKRVASEIRGDLAGSQPVFICVLKGAFVFAADLIRDVVIIEDIVDTGLTAVKMIDDIRALKPRTVRFATLLHKPASSRTGFTPDYVAFSIPPKFILGYGLDLDGKGRNLPDIYVIEEEKDN